MSNKEENDKIIEEKLTEALEKAMEESKKESENVEGNRTIVMSNEEQGKIVESNFDTNILESPEREQTIVIDNKEKKDILQSSKVNDSNWGDIAKDQAYLVRTREGEGGIAFAVNRDSLIFSEDKKERRNTICGELGLDRSQKLDQIAEDLCDPLNQRGMISLGGLVKLKDENNCRIRAIYPDKEGGEERPHKIDKTHSNLILDCKLGGEELDLTPAYEDLKAFYRLVEEKGPKEAMKIAIKDCELPPEKRVLSPYKKIVRNELERRRKEDRELEESIRVDMDNYIFEKTNIKSSNLKRVVLKINIEGQVNASERLLRAREKAVSRTGLGAKVLYTAETVGGRNVSIMMYMGRLDIEKTRKLFGLEGIIKKIGLPVAKDLERLHDFWGWEHRDIKPGNIFYDIERGRAVLGDLGTIKEENIRSDLTKGKIIGTPLYMSPEQARGEEITDERSDFYALGRTLESFFTGEDPYTMEGAQKIILAIANGEKPFALTHPNREYSLYEDLGINDLWSCVIHPFKYFKRKKFINNLEKVLAWLCQFDKEKRPISCKEIYEDLEAVANGEKPLNVNAYLKQSGMNRKKLIEGAYVTGKEIVSEETRLAVQKNTIKWAKIAIATGLLGTGIGYGLARGIDYLDSKVEQVNGHNK